MEMAASRDIVTPITKPTPITYPLPIAEGEEDPDCVGDAEGKYTSHGNRHVRYANICVQEVNLMFTATPGYALHYNLLSKRCADSSLPNWGSPTGFFSLPVADQINQIRSSVHNDIVRLNELCNLELVAERFIDPHFEEFYEVYGDGWWVERSSTGVRLNPEWETE